MILCSIALQITWYLYIQHKYVKLLPCKQRKLTVATATDVNSVATVLKNMTLNA